MKSTFSRMVAIALTMWLGLAAGAANAGTLTMSAWGGNATDGYSAFFGNNSVASSFNNWLNFTLPSDSSGTGGANAVSGTLNNYGQNVTFSAFNLYQGGTLPADKIATGSTGSSYSEFFYAGPVPGNYWLNVAGSRAGSIGSYSGNISVNPVPEPETYAMMLAGLGLLGFSARRRNNNT